MKIISVILLVVSLFGLTGCNIYVEDNQPPVGPVYYYREVVPGYYHHYYNYGWHQYDYYGPWEGHHSANGRY